MHVGGEHDAVIDADPGSGVVTAQLSVHPVGTPTTAGWDEIQVSGVLLRRASVSDPASDVFPITSVTTAVSVWAVPLLATKLV